MAFCTNCGSQIPDDAVFCNKCGTKVAKIDVPYTAPVAPEPVMESQEPVNETPYNNGSANNNYNGGAGTPPVAPGPKKSIFASDTLEMIVQIVAIILALINIGLFVKYGLGAVLRVLRGLLGIRGIPGLFTFILATVANVFRLATGAVCAASAVVLANAVYNWSREKASKYALAFTATSLGSFVVYLIYSIVGIIVSFIIRRIHRASYDISFDWKGLLGFFFFAVLTAAIWIAVMYLAKIDVMSSINTTKIVDEVKEAAFFVIDEVKQVIADIKAKRAEKAANAPAPAPGPYAAPRTQPAPGSYSQANGGYMNGGNGSVVSNNPAYNPNNGPANGGFVPRGRLLKTDRNFVIVILLSIVTCGIYPIIFWYQFFEDVNIACADDGETTPNYIIMILLSGITCGIYAMYYMYKVGDRMYRYGLREHIMITDTGSTILLWNLLGSLLCGLGPIIASVKLINNLNTLSVAYNSKVLANNQ